MKSEPKGAEGDSWKLLLFDFIPSLQFHCSGDVPEEVEEFQGKIRRILGRGNLYKKLEHSKTLTELYSCIFLKICTF